MLATRLSLRVARRARALSAWAGVPAAPADPIIGLNQDFAADPSPDKVLLGVGAYRDDAGKPFVLPSIAEAERAVVDAALNHEYAAITGDADFLRLSLEFVYGADSAPLAEGRVAAAQALSSAPPDDAGVAALSSGLDGVDVQPLPDSVTVEELETDLAVLAPRPPAAPPPAQPPPPTPPPPEQPPPISHLRLGLGLGFRVRVRVS